MPQVINLFDLISKGAIESLSYALKFQGTIPPTINGQWNPAFLRKAFESSQNVNILVDLVQSRYTFMGQSGNMGEIYALQVRDNFTGERLFGFSGTEFRLRTHSQKRTVAARAMAERKTVGHRS